MVAVPPEHKTEPIMDVTVRKTNGSYEEFDRVKLMNGIREAYKGTGQTCPEEVVVSIVENLYI